MVNYGVEGQIAYLAHLANEDSEAAAWVRTLREYFGGEHPTYLTDRQEEFLGLRSKSADHLFAHNLCGLVVAAVVERLMVTGFGPAAGEDMAGDALAEAAWGWWESNRMDAGQDDLYEAACRDGAGYVIVDWDAEQARPRWTLNWAFDGTQGIKVHRDPDTDMIRFASKRWQTADPLKPGESGKTRLTLYFPDRVEKWVSSTEEGNQAGWVAITDDDNEPWPIPWVDGQGRPLGMAVVPFENPGGSELDDVIPLQDMLNKADLDLVAATDMGGFRILWASGVTPQIDSSTGEEREITVAPGRLLRMSDASARLGAIEPVPLAQMLLASRYWIESIAGTSRTPQYLFQAQGAEQPSGESLKMQEVGLIAKSQRKQKVFGNAWEDVAYLSARLWNRYRPGEALDTEARLATLWDDLASRDELQDAQIAKVKLESGLPAEQVWREWGYDEALIQDWLERESEPNLGEQLLRAYESGVDPVEV